MAALNPYENAPPGWEPARAPAPIDSGLTYRTLHEKQFRRFSDVRFRPASKSNSTIRLLRPPMLASFEWDPIICAHAAYAIGMLRADFLNKRRDPLYALKEITGGVGASIDWRNSKPYLAIAGKQMLFANLATKATEILFAANSVNKARETYNEYNCQGSIALSTSTGSPPMFFPGNGNPWENGDRHCTVTNENWEISYDGGLTWHPLVVQVTRCVQLS